MVSTGCSGKQTTLGAGGRGSLWVHIQGIQWKRDKQVENGSFYLNKKTRQERKEKPGAASMGWKRYQSFASCSSPAQQPPSTTSSCQVKAGSRNRGEKLEGVERESCLCLLRTVSKHPPGTSGSSFPGRGDTCMSTKPLPQPRRQGSHLCHPGEPSFSARVEVNEQVDKTPLTSQGRGGVAGYFLGAISAAAPSVPFRDTIPPTLLSRRVMCPECTFYMK